MVICRRSSGLRAGLEWQKQHRHELVSSFPAIIPCREWVRHCGNWQKHRMRSRFQVTPPLRLRVSDGVRRLGRTVPGKQIASIRRPLPRANGFVERFLHEKAKKLAEEYRTPRYDAFYRRARLGRNRQGVRLLERTLGNRPQKYRRCALEQRRRPRRKYAAAAQGARDAYQESDFSDRRAWPQL